MQFTSSCDVFTLRKIKNPFRLLYTYKHQWQQKRTLQSTTYKWFSCHLCRSCGEGLKYISGTMDYFCCRTLTNRLCCVVGSKYYYSTFSFCFICVPKHQPSLININISSPNLICIKWRIVAQTSIFCLLLKSVNSVRP